MTAASAMRALRDAPDARGSASPARRCPTRSGLGTPKTDLRWVEKLTGEHRTMRKSANPARSPLGRRCAFMRVLMFEILFGIGLGIGLGGCGTPPEIEREPAPQAALATRVKVALAESPAVDAAAVFVDAGEDGQVRLGGFADSAEVRDQAGQIAGSVSGVQGVDNRIELR